MGFKVSQIELDPERSKGIWVNQDGREVTTPNPDDWELLVAPLDSEEFDIAVTAAVRRYRAKHGIIDDLSDADIREVTLDAMVETILLNWRHAEDDDGKPIAYTKEVAKEKLRKIRILYKNVEAVSRNRSNFKKQVLAKDSKNLPMSLSGGSATGASSTFSRRKRNERKAL
jgi:hypothetical protein